LRIVCCEVVRRGRFLVADPYLEPGYPLALGRRGSAVAAEGELVLVEVAPTGGRARVVARLGSPWDVRALLHGAAGEAGAARDFPADAEAEALALPTDPPPPAGDRRDLRDRIAFTVDPGTAKDHDDALTVERDGEGLRVLVHIADVAAAVPEGSALDREALARGFSSYLPGRVDPMLPPELSAGLCSLVPDRPRDAVTVELPFDAALRPGRPSFYRSQIVSRRRFAYDDVERILQGADDALAEPLHDAARVATALRERRTARGALTIPSREIEITLDEGRVAAVRMIGEPAAHALVEELMIAANEAVAELLARRRAPALYRVHEHPDPAGVERLYDQLADLGVPTPPLPELLLPADAAAAVGHASELVTRHAAAVGRGAEAWTTLLLRSVMQARYASANGGHAGLATPYYCHFTSPIRRYPDLTVHRALLGALGLGPVPDRDGLDDLAVQLSEREREWTRLERRGDAICLAVHLREQDDDERGPYAGEITGLIGGGLFVRFEGVYDGFVPSRRLGTEEFEVSDLGTALVGREGHRFRLGDPIAVSVERIDAPRGRVTLSPAPRRPA
jgi:ribonuclease R